MADRIGIDWRHAKPDSPGRREAHAKSADVEPRHDGTGHWVCHVCREPINDAGKAIDMSLKGLSTGRVLTADPDQPGLQVEGS